MFEVIANKFRTIKKYVKDHGGIFGAIKALFGFGKMPEEVDDRSYYEKTMEDLVDEDTEVYDTVNRFLDMPGSELTDQERFEMASAIIVFLGAIKRAGKGVVVGQPLRPITKTEQKILFEMASRLLASITPENTQVAMTKNLQFWSIPITGDLMDNGDAFTQQDLEFIHGEYDDEVVRKIFY
jgi:hypothetical protein